MSSKARSRRKRHDRKKLLKRVRNRWDKQTVFVKPEPGQVRVSEALRQVAAPLLKEARTREQAHACVLLSSLSWNLAVLPESKRQSYRQTFEAKASEAFPATDPQMRTLVDDLMARKQALFPDDNRMILDVEVTDEGNEWRIMAAAVQAP